MLLAAEGLTFASHADPGPHYVLERVSFENDLLFGTSPVLRRDARRVRAREVAKEE